LEAWHAVFDVVTEQKQGKPIGLVEATKIAASSNETAKDYFSVSDRLPEDKCGETFLELIHFLVSCGRYLLHVKNDFSSKSAGGGSIQIVSQEPIVVVKYVDAAATTTIEGRKERKK
jgi:hypothetical protein